MPLFSRSKSSKSGVTVEAGATPPSSKATAGRPAPAPASSEHVLSNRRVRAAGRDAVHAPAAAARARQRVGAVPQRLGRRRRVVRDRLAAQPAGGARRRQPVLFSDKYRAEFSVALAREARALLTRRQRDPAFKLYVVTANNDKETAVITGCAPPPPPPPPPPALPPRRPPLSPPPPRAPQLAAARRGVEERRAVGGVRRRMGGAARRRGAEAVDVDGRGAATRRHQSLDG